MKLIRVSTIPLSISILLKGQLAFMSNYFEVKVISSPPSKDLNLSEDFEIVEFIEVSMTRYMSPLKDLLSLWKMIKIFKKEKPTIVHTHTPKAGLIGMLAAKFAKVPIRMHTVAGLPLIETYGLKRCILNLTERITYLCATNVYPNSFGLYKYIIDNKFTKIDKLKVISNGSSNGINTSFFSPLKFCDNENYNLRKELKISQNEFVFIFVGRLVSHKGLNELVYVFTQLNLDSVKLLLVGPYENELDPLFNSTVNLIDQNTNILSVGFQNDVRKYFAISNCLVFPSYREGFPNVVMQAGAMGLPSIVTNINGCNEIIEDDINGTLILPKSTEDLYKAMLRMVSDLQLRNNLAANARNMIISRYDQQLFWNALLEEYNHLVSSILKKG
jgi:glycosyltransferase involved in cell wall biosynthesis